MPPPCTAHLGRLGVVCAQGKMSVLPAGQKQARVSLPGVLAVVSPTAALDAALAPQLDAAIQAGLTGVVLRNNDDGDAATLYDAALALKQALRGRVPLLVVDRTDIASAAEATGVVLSDKGRSPHNCTDKTLLCWGHVWCVLLDAQLCVSWMAMVPKRTSQSPNVCCCFDRSRCIHPGVPTVVARRMLGGATALVACSTPSPSRAVETAADGANFVILEVRWCV